MPSCPTVKGQVFDPFSTRAGIAHAECFTNGRLGIMQSILEYRRLGKGLQCRFEQYGLCAAAGERLERRDANSSLDEKDLESGRNPPIAPSYDAKFFRAVRQPSQEPQGQCPTHQTRSPMYPEASGQTLDLRGLAALRSANTPTTECVNVRIGARSCCNMSDQGDPTDEKAHIVTFEGPDDQLNPQNWSRSKKWISTAIVGSTGFLIGWSSAIDSSIIEQASKEFGVSKITESLSTGLYLVALGIGSLFSGPFSETVGRNPVYIITLLIFMLFEVASALAPDIETQLASRFLAGLFGCTPFTTFGASVSDMWMPTERTFVFPICACLSFLGPFLSPVVGAYIAQSSLISWRWTDWVTLILAGLIVCTIIFFLPETYGPILLKWKASHLRAITGDKRMQADIEIRQTNLLRRLLYSVYRPFDMFFHEIMVFLFTLYLAVVYVVLFTFLTGYTFIYTELYGFSQASTGLCFTGMNVGFLFALSMVPWIYWKYKRDLVKATERGEAGLPPEERLWYAMLGAPCLPISLFWMGWTSNPSVSYWSSLVASVFFGFGVMGIFISTYQYLIDSFETYAASALVGATFMRYIAAGIMVPVSYPMYANLGVHWTLTIMACVSLLMMPIPYLFCKFGHRIRTKSSKFFPPDRR